MKKIGKILLWVLAVIGLLSLVIWGRLLVKVNRTGEAQQIWVTPSEKTVFQKQVAKLQAAGAYAPDTINIRMASVRDEARARVHSGSRQATECRNR